MIRRGWGQSAWLTLLFVGLALGGGLALGWLTLKIDNPLVIVLAGLGLVLALGSFWRPEWCLLALVFITYTRLSDILVQYHGAPSVAKLIVPFLLGIVLLRWVMLGERPTGWERSTVLVVGYGLVGAVSLFYAADPELTGGALEDYLKDALIAVVMTLLIKDLSTWRRVIWALLAAGMFMGTLTVYQYLTGTFANNYGGFAQASVQNIVGQTNDYRVAGPIGDPNFYAQILLVLVPLALDRLWHETTWPRRLLAGWALGACVLSILFTFSRGAFLALLVISGLLLVRRMPRPGTLLITLAGLIVVSQFIPAGYLDRLKTLTDLLPVGDNVPANEISFRGRSSEVAVGWAMFMDHPLVGVGWNNYPVHYLSYSRQLGIDPRSVGRSAHNLYLEIAAESGLVGLLVFGVVLWYLFRRLSRAQSDFERAHLNDYAGSVAALRIGLLGYLVAAIFLHLAYPRFFWMLLGIGLAAVPVARQAWGIRRVVQAVPAVAWSAQPVHLRLPPA